MGAAPSREAEASYLEELRSRRHKAWKAERRRKEISLLPLTKTFMHFVQPKPSSRPNSPNSSKSAGRRSRTDGSSGGTSSSSRKNFLPAVRADDASPAELPFMQQLYSAYCEPSTQFYCRKETWGRMDRLPAELFYPTIESFYEATVGCYEEDVYESNDAMQQVLEEHLMKERIYATGDGAGQPVPPKGAEPVRRPKKVLKSVKIRPTPCAICFEYPTCSVAPPPQAGDDASPAASLNRSGAPHGSVVFAPYCSFMVIGFVGLVPLRHSRKANAAAFLRPPSNSAGDEGEGSNSNHSNSGGGAASTSVGEGGDAEYELVAFIAKSAGEQHLGRALFQAAFLYTEQCRRAGLFSTPIPSTRFSCFLTDVPSLCFLREVRLRCADAGWTKRLARALRQVRLAGRHLALQMDRALAGDVCAFMAECYEKLDFHPPPTSAPCLFYGFVGDAGSQILPSSEASPSIAPAPLPLSGSAEVRAVLQEKAERDALLSRGGLGGGPGNATSRSNSGTRSKKANGNSNSRNTSATADADSCTAAADAVAAGDATVQLYCIVGTSKLTVDNVKYPHGTVLERTVQVATGNFLSASWSVAEDRAGQEKPPVDFNERSPEDRKDYCISTAPESSSVALKPALVTSDVLLSWSKDLYLHARVAEAKDARWVSAYPQEYYAMGMKGYTKPPTAAQLEALKPPSSTLQAAAGTQHDSGTAGNKKSPLTAEALKAVTAPCEAASGAKQISHNLSGNIPTTTPTAAAAVVDSAASANSPENVFYLWEFEHQKLRYTVGLVPNFVRAQQRANNAAAASGNSAANRRNSSKNNRGNARPGRRTSTQESVDPTSETDVAGAATGDVQKEVNAGAAGLSEHSARSDSAHSSNRSVDTYHTAASSHSTMSNFAMAQPRRSSRQKRYFLSLGTDTIYENGVPVSGQIEPITADRGSRAVSDDGYNSSRRSSAYGGDASGGVGIHGGSAQAGSHNADFAADEATHNPYNNNSNNNSTSGGNRRFLVNGSGGSSTANGFLLRSPLQRDSGNSSQYDVLRSPPTQLTSPPHTPSAYVQHPLATQPPLQRRLSGGVSQGVRSRRDAEGANSRLLYDDVGGQLKGGGSASNATTVTTAAEVGGGMATAFPMTKVQPDARPLPQFGLRRGVYGPSQALMDEKAQKALSVTQPTRGGKAEPPVMDAPGDVQNTHRGSDGSTAYRWDWRGAATKKS